jgi:hypothetical protein
MSSAAMVVVCLVGLASLASRAEEPAVTATAEEAPPAWRVGASVGGLVVPLFDGAGGVVWGAGAELQVVRALSSRFDVRGVLNYTHAEQPGVAVNLVLGGVSGTAWFGTYGLGAMAAAGWAGFVDLNGWNVRASTFTVALLATPVRLRFGTGIQHELFLDAGLSLFFNRLTPARPLGRIGYGISF